MSQQPLQQPEQNSSEPMVVNVSEDLSKKLEDIENEKNDRIAEIKQKSGSTTPSAEEPPPIPNQPAAPISPNIREYAVNTEQDEVDELLNELFKYAVYHPEASAENTFPFVRVMLKERATNLASSISAVENGDKNMVAGLERIFGTLRGIWDTFELDHNQGMQRRQHLINAVNGRIADLKEEPEILRHKLLIVEKAMQDLEQKYDVPNAQRNIFGGGLL